MKYVKILALAAVAAGALMAFIGAGTASASVICSTTADPCPAGQRWTNGITVDLSATTSTRLTNLANGSTIDTCKGGTVTGEFTQGTQGGVTTPTIHTEKHELTWTECTFPTKTIKLGTLEIHKIAGTSNGTVTGTGFEVTINTVLFGSCIYGTGEKLDLGTITEGNPAIFHAETPVKFISGGAACPTNTAWDATYAVTSPATTGSVSSS
jgi:hypothetical protein